MLKKLVITLLATTLISAATAAPASAYRPEDGAIFNNPWGASPAKDRLLTKLASTINAARPGSTVRIAAYSNDRKDITDALIAAHKRGVHVQVLLNGNWTSRQTTRMQRRARDRGEQEELPADLPPVVPRRRRATCTRSSSSSPTSARRSHVVMFGSVNLTGFGAKTQWNDLFTTTDRRYLHNVLRGVFKEMKRDKPVKRPYLNRPVG